MLGNDDLSLPKGTLALLRTLHHIMHSNSGKKFIMEFFLVHAYELVYCCVNMDCCVNPIVMLKSSFCYSHLSSRQQSSDR